MLMTVSIEASPRDRLGVPELAVVSEGETRYVFVIGADGKVARTAVKTGTRQNGLVEVTDGLRRGQRVVGDGVVKVADGMSESDEHTSELQSLMRISYAVFCLKKKTSG